MLVFLAMSVHFASRAEMSKGQNVAAGIAVLACLTVAGKKAYDSYRGPSVLVEDDMPCGPEDSENPPNNSEHHEEEERPSLSKKLEEKSQGGCYEGENAVADQEQPEIEGVLTRRISCSDDGRFLRFLNRNFPSVYYIAKSAKTSWKARHC